MRVVGKVCLYVCARSCMCVCACACVCVWVCVYVCVCGCVHACVCSSVRYVCVCMKGCESPFSNIDHSLPWLPPELTSLHVHRGNIIIKIFTYIHARGVNTFVIILRE